MGMRTCQKILQAAFDLPYFESAQLMVAFPSGFWIVARPSQFARFIILRHKWGNCINGVRDLQPELIDGDPPTDLYQIIADETGIRRGVVKIVALTMGFNEDEASVHMRNQINVADRPHQRCYS